MASSPKDEALLDIFDDLIERNIEYWKETNDRGPDLHVGDIYFFKPTSHQDDRAARVFIERIRSVEEIYKNHVKQLAMSLFHCLDNEIAQIWYAALPEEERAILAESSKFWLTILKRDFAPTMTGYSIPATSSAPASSPAPARSSVPVSISLPPPATSSTLAEPLFAAHVDSLLMSASSPLPTEPLPVPASLSAAVDPPFASTSFSAPEEPPPRSLYVAFNNSAYSSAIVIAVKEHHIDMSVSIHLNSTSKLAQIMPSLPRIGIG